MSDVKQLAHMLMELEDQLTVCMRCGMCQAACPLFEQTGREADVARGKLALLDALGRNILDDPKGVEERLSRCLLCGSCAANCPSGVSVLEIFIKARAILGGYMGLSPAKRLALRGMLAKPRLFDRLTELGARFQGFFTKPVNDMLGTSCARFMSPLIGGRHFRPLADVPFHKRVSELNTEPGKSGIRAAFFVGCLLDKIFPDIADAVIKVLNHHGVGIYMPGEQGCCGIPALASGDTKTFFSLLDHNLSRFDPDKFDYLITACATCTGTIKKTWPVIAEKEKGQADRVKAISEKTMDINQFLVSVVGVKPPVSADPAEKADLSCVTYHDPCHLKKSLGVFTEPRDLIRANPEYRLEEMKESDWCCGLGGSFSLHYYEISKKIGQKKEKNILDTGCSTLATGCPACMIQISDALSRAGAQVTIRHPVEIYAETLTQKA